MADYYNYEITIETTEGVAAEIIQRYRLDGTEPLNFFNQVEIPGHRASVSQFETWPGPDGVTILVSGSAAWDSAERWANELRAEYEGRANVYGLQQGGWDAI